MYPRSTSYLAQTPESEADLADGLGIVNRHAPPLNMVTFNPTPEDKKELELQKGQPGVCYNIRYNMHLSHLLFKIPWVALFNLYFPAPNLLAFVI
jgi:hypothetical protein